MNVVLPLTKGHLSNKDGFFWQKGCPEWRVITVHSTLPDMTTDLPLLLTHLVLLSPKATGSGITLWLIRPAFVGG